MASTYYTPGVYVEEISTLPASIAPVSTAIPAFIGYTDGGPTIPTGLPVVKRITSMIEFEQNFGKGNDEEFTVAVNDDTTSGARTIVVTPSSPSITGFNLYYSMQMYFANGGGPCYVVSIGSFTDTIAQADFVAGLAAIAKEDEPTLLLFPDASNLTPVAYGAVYAAALAQCNDLQDRFVVGDFVGNITETTEVATFRGGLGANYLKYGAVYAPDLISSLGYSYADAGVGVTYTIDNVAESSGTLDTYDNGGGNINLQIYNQIKQAIPAQFPVILPPSGAMAGIYAAVDRDRGVWKAPANVSVNRVSAPEVAITEAQQGDLNVDATSGKSINVIRTFTGRGILVWGARTLDGNSNEWRYVPVRRLFIFAEESIKKASEFIVFEPNDKNTWLRVKGMISNFLTDLWRQGALVGDKAEQAYFVKVGLGETMSAQDILEGKCIIQVGLAAVRPAEFIILQFMHKLQES